MVLHFSRIQGLCSVLSITAGGELRTRGTFIADHTDLIDGSRSSLVYLHIRRGALGMLEVDDGRTDPEVDCVYRHTPVAGRHVSNRTGGLQTINKKGRHPKGVEKIRLVFLRGTVGETTETCTALRCWLCLAHTPLKKHEHEHVVFLPIESKFNCSGLSGTF